MQIIIVVIIYTFEEFENPLGDETDCNSEKTFRIMDEYE